MKKIQESKEKLVKQLKKHDPSKTFIGYTGGKDSTLTLWLVKQVCEENNLQRPKALFIDHGQHWQEMEDFVDQVLNQWNFEKVVAENNFLTKHEPHEQIPFEELPTQQQKEITRELEVQQDSIENTLNSLVGNHLLKTYPLNQKLQEENVEALLNGIRKDEHESRSNENFVSQRDTHKRIHPIINFTEREVWDATWLHMVPEETGWNKGYPDKKEDLNHLDFVPVSPKYFTGYRSLGSETSTEKSEEGVPAWKQNLEEGTERDGRAQQKDDEKVMERLRQFGYP